MKKLLLGFIVLLTACSSPLTSKVDMSAYGLDKKHNFVDMNFNELMNEVNEDEFTGIVYIGYETCPWCKEVVPILQSTAEEVGIDKIYYVNKKSQDNKDNPAWEQTFTDYLNEYIELQEYEGAPRIFVPEILVFLDGQLLDNYRGTFEGHNANERSLTTEEQQKLKDIYSNMMKLLK